MKNTQLSILLICALSTISCSTTKMNLDFSNELITKENTIVVKGTKGKALVGTKRQLKFDKNYNGKLKEGWTKTSDIVDKSPYAFFSKESLQRTLYENIGVDIDDITSKTSDKFQFTLANSSTNWIAFCHQQYEGKSTNYDILNRVDFSQGKSQKSDFNATFIALNDILKTKWQLELKYERETPDGIMQTFFNEGMAIETGTISNGKEVITIEQIYLRGNKMDNNQYAKIIKIVGGYKFLYENKPIGMVDLYSQSFSIFTIDGAYKDIVTLASTSLLLRNR